MRGEEVNVRSLEIVEAVSKRLDREPTVLAPSHHKTGHWKRWAQPAAGAALAASVAAFGIMLAPRFINQHENTNSEPGFKVVAQPLESDLPLSRVAAVSGVDSSQWKTLSDNKKIDKRLRSYLEQHSGYASPGGVQGVMPYTSFVSYDGK